MNGEPSSYDRPLIGLKVLDISQGVAGPYCGMLLAQYGADVIKVEPPWGDWARSIGTRISDHSAASIGTNRGKRSLSLDLRRPEGGSLLARLAARCDVLVESFRPGVAERLGVGYSAVREGNPKVIYLSISGFGQTGRLSGRTASDTVIQAFSGMMMVNRDAEGAPKYTGFLAVDYAAGMYAFQAATMSLVARPNEAAGRHIDISLAEAAGAYLSVKLIQSRLEGGNPGRINVPAGTYRTKDGWIAVSLTKEAHFAGLCEVIGRPELTTDTRFEDFATRAEHETALLPHLREAFLTRTTDDWLEKLAESDLLYSRVHSPGSWLEDPDMRASGFVADAPVPGLGLVPWVPLPGSVSPSQEDARSEWPLIGQHGRDILASELKMNESEIDELVDRGVIAVPGV